MPRGQEPTERVEPPENAERFVVSTAPNNDTFVVGLSVLRERDEVEWDSYDAVPDDWREHLDDPAGLSFVRFHGGEEVPAPVAREAYGSFPNRLVPLDADGYALDRHGNRANVPEPGPDHPPSPEAPAQAESDGGQYAAPLPLGDMPVREIRDTLLTGEYDDPATLDALENAEREGQERTTVLEAIDARRPDGAEGGG